MAGWVGLVGWLIADASVFTHKEVTRPAASLAQDRESTPAEPAVYTTMLRHQLYQGLQGTSFPFCFTKCRS